MKSVPLLSIVKAPEMGVTRPRSRAAEWKDWENRIDWHEVPLGHRDETT